MSNAPAWLACKNCLWWVDAEDGLLLHSCHFDQAKPLKKAPNSRCSCWTCKRCFEEWRQWEGEETNHLYCKILARKKPGKK